MSLVCWCKICWRRHFHGIYVVTFINVFVRDAMGNYTWLDITCNHSKYFMLRRDSLFYLVDNFWGYALPRTPGCTGQVQCFRSWDNISWRHIKWLSYFTIDKYLYDFVHRDLWYIMIDRNMCGYWRKSQITHDAKIVADRSMHHFVWLMWLTYYWMTCIILHNKWTSWRQHIDECNK